MDKSPGMASLLFAAGIIFPEYSGQNLPTVLWFVNTVTDIAPGSVYIKILMWFVKELLKKYLNFIRFMPLIMTHRFLGT